MALEPSKIVVRSLLVEQSSPTQNKCHQEQVRKQCSFPKSRKLSRQNWEKCAHVLPYQLVIQLRALFFGGIGRLASFQSRQGTVALSVERFFKAFRATWATKLELKPFLHLNCYCLSQYLRGITLSVSTPPS
jgi:hypothetical protein